MKRYKSDLLAERLSGQSERSATYFSLCAWASTTYVSRTRCLGGQVDVLYAFFDLGNIQDALLRLYVMNTALNVLWGCYSFCYSRYHVYGDTLLTCNTDFGLSCVLCYLAVPVITIGRLAQVAILKSTAAASC